VKQQECVQRGNKHMQKQEIKIESILRCSGGSNLKRWHTVRLRLHDAPNLTSGLSKLEGLK
jgi:hypothetical protein